jgi:hypothetical protein
MLEADLHFLMAIAGIVCGALVWLAIILNS